MGNDHISWYKTVTKGDSNRQASDKAGLNNATLGRQLKAGALSAENVIRIAEAYGESPIVSLIDLGFMSSKWMNEHGALTSLRKASDEELTDELLRRLHLLSDEEADDLAEQRKLSVVSDADDMNDETVRPFDYSEYAADSSEDETEARLERGEDLID